MSALEALSHAYDKRVAWTMALPRLGLPEVERHVFRDVPALDDAGLDFHSRTKDPTILCVEVMGREGRLALIPVAAHVSSSGHKITRDLVERGAHPLDIIVATYSVGSGGWTFRNSVEHLFWTRTDQQVLDRTNG